MSSKRLAEAHTSGPPSKKSFLLSEPINLGPVSTEEELDIKVLKIQNKNLFSRLEEKNSQEDEFKVRFSKLERLRENDHNIISAMNLAWNQLNEDIILMVQRFQETSEDDTYRINETTTAFLEKLSNRTTKGISEELEKRLIHSKEITKKFILALDGVLSRKDKLTQTIDRCTKKKEKLEHEDKSEISENQVEQDFPDVSTIDLEIRQENSILRTENKRLHDAYTSLHEKYHQTSTEFLILKDQHASSLKDNAELNSKQQDMEYDLQKATKQFEKLIKKLNETHEIAKAGAFTNPSAKLDCAESFQSELDSRDELAMNRLTELEKLQKAHQKLIEEHELLKQQLFQIPDEEVINSPKYKMLEIQFTMLFNDAQTIRKSCEEARRTIINNKNQHIQQLETLEAENEKIKKKVRGEISALEKSLLDTRRDLELLRVEYEHNMRAHEQIAPMAKEMRHLINSLQNSNQQLKGEVQRCKIKISEAQKKNKELEKDIPPMEEDSTESYIDRIETMCSPHSGSSQSSMEGFECDDLKVLKNKLKSAREKRKEMKLLLDMYKGVSKETRDKAELLKNEKTLKDKLEMIKLKLSVVTADTVKQARRFANQDHEKECKRLQAKIDELQKFISNTKQEEDALLSEMEFTGQAFEEMQEQSIRLMHQLREKDDTNLKLMSERIKSNQIQKLLREEKDLLNEKLLQMSNQIAAFEEVAKQFEEREKVLQTTIANMDKEISLRQQASDCHKRKVTELSEKCQELTFRLETALKQLQEVKTSLIEKSNQLEEETFKYNRIQEENIAFKKKLKKMEYLGASDEILVEEVKMYKAKLTCPCCNTHGKDAILTKCFHVFCFECLKTRYDTRQRKCPKCNATFGNNDFHKIYM
ncbi:E3 ubiquitin-protein ligase BRE1A isoform X1 [Hydra vulgaris]|uniref:E3 ubiquitin protein ligase n=1 Tax=Hydra vulgaris TaxID=6087 RepID=T2MB97_HYDVU|nr:E3 ubiquitin-protein ligase BRE1A [Hydra vulgaris]